MRYIFRNDLPASLAVWLFRCGVLINLFYYIIDLLVNLRSRSVYGDEITIDSFLLSGYPNWNMFLKFKMETTVGLLLIGFGMWLYEKYQYKKVIGG